MYGNFDDYGLSRAQNVNQAGFVMQDSDVIVVYDGREQNEHANENEHAREFFISADASSSDSEDRENEYAAEFFTPVEPTPEQSSSSSESEIDAFVTNPDESEIDPFVTNPDAHVVAATSSEPEPKREAKADSDAEDGDDGRTCSICLDVWTNSGQHRLASLRCGHLFGHSCVLRWLQMGCSAGARRCPQCNKKAHVKDIRVHYARSLLVLDTAEKDRLQKELEDVRREKNHLELELARANLNQELHQKALAELRQKVVKLEAQICNGQCHRKDQSLSQKSSQGQIPSRLGLLKSIEICRDSGCRVMAYNAGLKLLVASQKSSNYLFSGYGIKKIDAMEFQQKQFVFLHSSAIRDMAFHPQENNMLLTVSLDRCAKILNVSNNAVVHNCTTDSPLWSCSWDADNSNMFFVGSIDGIVWQYDVRSLSKPVSGLFPRDKSSVTSIAAVPISAGRTMSRGGILVARLDSCWAYELHGSEYVGSQLPYDGPFVSLYYDSSTEHILISTRPNSRHPQARHIVCEIPRASAGKRPLLNPIHTFHGSTCQNFLSRSCLVPTEGDTMVAAHHESSKTLALWSVSLGRRVIQSPAPQSVLDLCPVQVNGNQYLATLSENWLRVYNMH